MGKKYLPI